MLGLLSKAPSRAMSFLLSDTFSDKISQQRIVRFIQQVCATEALAMVLCSFIHTAFLQRYFSSLLKAIRANALATVTWLTINSETVIYFVGDFGAKLICFYT